MKRRLVLMRHAESRNGGLLGGDHDRELTPAGWMDAKDVARQLRQLEEVPAVALCSDATRTRQTCEVLAETLDAAPEVRPSPTLYLASASSIVAELEGLDDTVCCVALVGHNPGISEAASALAGRLIGLETANAVVLLGEGPSWVEALAPARWNRVAKLAPIS